MKEIINQAISIIHSSQSSRAPVSNQRPGLRRQRAGEEAGAGPDAAPQTSSDALFVLGSLCFSQSSHCSAHPGDVVARRWSKGLCPSLTLRITGMQDAKWVCGLWTWLRSFIPG